MNIRKTTKTKNMIKMTITLWKDEEGREAVLYAKGYPSGNIQTMLYIKDSSGGSFKKEGSESLFLGRFFIDIVSSLSKSAIQLSEQCRGVAAA